jgi:AcrR family transcriptional regulator
MMLNMPYPSHLSASAILSTSRALLEQSGPDGLAMRALARELGVSAPSLYFHVESRQDLLHQLIKLGLEELGGALRPAAAAPGSPRQRATALADAYTGFARANPQLFTLIFGPCGDELVDASAGDAASAPVLKFAASLVGPERALFLAQALWSLVHGYTVLSLARQFRQNPDPEAGFAYALDLLLAGATIAASPVPA